jgi:hypothetical protein
MHSRHALQQHITQKIVLLIGAYSSFTAATGFQVFGTTLSMENKGIESVLGVTAWKTQDLSLILTLNFAKNETKVTSLGGLDTSYILGGQWVST